MSSPREAGITSRYHFAKNFGFVLPHASLVEWLADSFTGCRRVVSIGAGTSFLELALQLRFMERAMPNSYVSLQGSKTKRRLGSKDGTMLFSTQESSSVTFVVCVENNSEGLGLHNHQFRGFHVHPMERTTVPPALSDDDGVLICWGRSPANGEGNRNIWTDMEREAVAHQGVRRVVVIGGMDENSWFPCERWGGLSMDGRRCRQECARSSKPSSSSTSRTSGCKEARGVAEEGSWTGRYSDHGGRAENGVANYWGLTDRAVCWTRSEEKSSLPEAEDAVEKSEDAVEESKYAMEESEDAVEESSDDLVALSEMGNVGEESNDVVRESIDMIEESRGIEESEDASEDAIEESKDAVAE